jgi:KOW motif
MSQSPLNLTARDFDAYAPEKATSNAYSRPRLEVKQRALAWARGVVARLAELGIDVEVHGSDEHPSIRNKKRVDSQWVFFSRDEAAREELGQLLAQGRSISQEIDDPSPFTRHAFLALRLDVSSVEVCFAVHPEARVDVDNLHARLDEGAETLAAELLRALAALPEELKLGVGEERVPCDRVTKDELRGMLERAAAGQVPLWVGWSVVRETALAHAEILDDQLEDAIIALAPIYKLVAWSRENDHIALDRRLEGVLEERARTHAAAEAQTKRWRSEQEEARRRSFEQCNEHREEAHRAAPGPAVRRPSLATLFNSDGRKGGSAPREGGPPPEAHHDRPRDPPREGPRNEKRAKPTERPPRDAVAMRANFGPHATTPGDDGPARAEPPLDAPALRLGGASAPTGAIEKGARVRVRSGPFADKIGVIGDIDGRGGARVLLGLLSTRLDVTDLEPAIEGRERPAIQSSHRRPLPPAPRKAR